MVIPVAEDAGDRVRRAGSREGMPPSQGSAVLRARIRFPICRRYAAGRPAPTSPMNGRLCWSGCCLGRPVDYRARMPIVEISDLIVRHDPATGARLPVRRDEVLAAL